MSRLSTVRERQQESLHPHPLSCDLTRDSLLHRDEEFGEGHRTRVVLRMVLAVVVLPAIVVTAATFGALVLVSGGGWAVFASAAAAGLFMCFVSAPVLLATLVKVSQDDAVRDGVTAQLPTGVVPVATDR